MSDSNEIKFKVFYSWQSDLPSAVNFKLIRGALSDAASALSADPNANVHIFIDEATRELPGSPNIADAIFAKIRGADLFACDLTKVAETSNSNGEKRKYCNPNVAIELGYAVRVLGWSRIIILFNQGYGTIPDDLPFDARGHRTSPYNCKADFDPDGKLTATCSAKVKSESGNLRATLKEALKLVIEQNPKRPHELELGTPQEIQRARDLQQLQKLFKWINLNVMDQIIRSVAEGKMLYLSEFLYDRLSADINSSSFYIADEELRTKLGTFVSAWKNTFTYTHEMDAHPSGNGGYFRLPLDIFTSAEQEQHYNYTCESWRPLREGLDDFIQYVRLHYLEIDPTLAGDEEVRAYYAREEANKAKMKEVLGDPDE